MIITGFPVGRDTVPWIIASLREAVSVTALMTSLTEDGSASNPPSFMIILQNEVFIFLKLNVWN